MTIWQQIYWMGSKWPHIRETKSVNTLGGRRLTKIFVWPQFFEELFDQNFIWRIFFTLLTYCTDINFLCQLNFFTNFFYQHYQFFFLGPNFFGQNLILTDIFFDQHFFHPKLFLTKIFSVQIFSIKFFLQPNLFSTK